MLNIYSSSKSLQPIETHTVSVQEAGGKGHIITFMLTLMKVCTAQAVMEGETMGGKDSGSTHTHTHTHIHITVCADIHPRNTYKYTLCAGTLTYVYTCRFLENMNIHTAT